jgi:hypothetical protein
MAMTSRGDRNSDFKFDENSMIIALIHIKRICVSRFLSKFCIFRTFFDIILSKKCFLTRLRNLI